VGLLGDFVVLNLFQDLLKKRVDVGKNAVESRKRRRLRNPEKLPDPDSPHIDTVAVEYRSKLHRSGGAPKRGSGRPRIRIPNDVDLCFDGIAH
jgi:hypothetical protein